MPEEGLKKQKPPLSQEEWLKKHETKEGERGPLVGELPEGWTPEALVKFCDDRFAEAEAGRQSQDAVWRMNQMFLLDRQWVEWPNPGLPPGVEPVPMPGDVRIVINLVDGAVMKHVASMSSYKEKVDVLPNDQSQKSLNEAEVAQRCLDSISRDQKWEQNKTDWAMHLPMYGTAISKVFLDTRAGDAMEVPETTLEPTPFPMVHAGIRMIDEGGRPLYQAVDEKGKPRFRRQFFGEAAAQPVWPPQFYPDPAGNSTDTMRYVIHVRPSNANEIWERYAVKVESKGMSTGTPNQGEVTMLQATGIQPTSFKDVVWLKEMTEQPTLMFPHGRIFTWAENQLLQYTPEPNLPFNSISGRFRATIFKPVPGRFWGKSLVETLIPAQMAYNSAISNVIEIANRQGKPKWFVDSRTQIREKTFTDATAELIFFNGNAGGTPPVLSQVPQLSPHLMTSIQIMRQDFDDLAAKSSPVTRPNVRAGIGISKMDEIIEAPNAVTAAAFANFIEANGKSLLWIIEHFYTEERKFKIVGPGGHVQLFSLRGKDINGHYDLHVSIGLGLPQSITLRQNVVSQLLMMGLIPDRKKAIQLMRLEDIDPELFGNLAKAESQALEENDLMLQGQYTPVEDWHQHGAHIEKCEEVMNQRAFREFPPEVQELFIFHREEHKRKLAEDPIQLRQWVMMHTMEGMPSQPMGKKAARAMQTSQGGQERALAGARY